MASWVWSFALAIQHVLTDRLPDLGVRGCFNQNRRTAIHSVMDEALLFTLPTTASMLCNTLIACSIVGRNSKVSPLKLTNNAYLEREKRATRALLGIGLVALFCWTPATSYFMTVGLYNGAYSVMCSRIMVALEQLSCALNPLVYHRCLPDLATAVNRLFQRR